jgi:hypothetical protein
MSIFSRLRARLLGREDDSPERLPSPDDLVILVRPEGEPEALMMQEMLAAEGIVAMVRNRDAATARGGGWGPSWAYDVMVKRADLRRAREVVGADPDE